MNRGASQDRWWTWAPLLVAVGALALRLPRLDRRPMHNDEAVNAILFGKLLEQGVYRYDPDEYHGPALHYATLPFAVLSGAKDLDHLSERTLRTVTVTAGVLMILVLGLLRDALGRAGSLWAAVLLACSPAMVFYSRYFIHEMGLVLFTLLFLAAAWRYLNRPGPAWALVAGVALGLMHATKETFVFSLAAAVPAAAACTMWRRDPTSGTSANRFSVRPSHLALGFAAAALVSVTLFTSFFTHARGPIDAWATYLPWIRRAGGASPHLHPWTEYFRRLLWFQAERGPVWTEGSVAVLTLAGMIAAARRRTTADASPGFARFLAIYSIVLAAIYTAVPYKTPWCLLNFFVPAVLLAGVGAATLLDAAKRPTLRGALAIGFVAAIAHLGWQAWRASQDFSSHRGNPYVYAQTVPNAVELTDRVRAIAAVDPKGPATEVKVIAPESDYWPLPWYLRSLKQVWWLDGLPDDPFAPIVVVSARLRAGLDDRSNRRYLSVGYYELRPREFFELYVEFELWKRFVATLPPRRDDEGE